MEDVTATAPAEATTSTPPAHRRSFFKELPFLVVVAFLLALLIKSFLVQAFFIPSGSMEHTLDVGDRVLVNKVVYHLRGIHRGEIVVFNGLDNFEEATTVAAPSNGLQQVLRKVTGVIGFGAPDEKDYIKRVIGLPGDRVMCCDAQGRVTVQDKTGQPVALNEPYVFLAGFSGEDRTKYFCAAGQGPSVCPPGAPGLLVPPGRLWVMGDHRNNSADSRAHFTDANHGTVPEDKVVGRAFVVVYPLERAKVLHVPGAFDHVTALAPTPALYGGGVALALPLALRVKRRRASRRVR
jgi:signal peptidase I